MTDLFQYLLFWVQNHPVPVIAAAVAFFVLTWLLNRRSTIDKEAERVVKSLVEGSREKYKDVRPLR